MISEESLALIAADLKEHRDEAIKLLLGGAPDMVAKAQVYATLALVDATIWAAVSS